MAERKGDEILSSAHIGRLLLRLSVPAMIGMMVQALFNVVDTIFVGRGVGTLGIAGITIVFPIQMFVMALSQMIGIGGASIISRALGSKNIERANKTLGGMLLSATLIGIGITVIGYLFTDDILRLFGATESILPYAREYLTIILIGNVFFPFAVSANSVIRAEGRAGFAMITMLVSAILNIILDPIFIFSLGMGIKGAAIATVLAKAATAIWVTVYFFTEKSMLRLSIKNWRFHRGITGEMFAIGTASFIRLVAASILIIFVNNLLASYGSDIYIAAMGIILRLMQFFTMPILGVAQGLQPIVGFNYGAKRFDKTKRALNLALIVATGIAIFGFVLLFFFSKSFFTLFTKDSDLIHSGVKPLKIVIMLLPLVGSQIIGASLFQAIGKAVNSIILSITRRALFLIPLLFILPRIIHLKGVWAAFPISDALSFTLTASLLIVQLREFTEKHERITVTSPRQS